MVGGLLWRILRLRLGLLWRILRQMLGLLIRNRGALDDVVSHFMEHGQLIFFPTFFLSDWEMLLSYDLTRRDEEKGI